MAETIGNPPCQRYWTWFDQKHPREQNEECRSRLWDRGAGGGNSGRKVGLPDDEVGPIDVSVPVGVAGGPRFAETAREIGLPDAEVAAIDGAVAVEVARLRRIERRADLDLEGVNVVIEDVAQARDGLAG